MKGFLQRRWALLGLLVLLAACGSRPAAPTSQAAGTSPAATPPRLATPASGAPIAELISGPGFEGVIFSREHVEQDQIAQGLLRAAEGSWTPDRATILALEEQLGPYLEQATGESHPALAARLSEYKRQYVGLVRAGRQIIYVNAFCRTLNIDWQREFVLVDDGGACFFNLIYDPQRGDFSNLAINGES